MNKIMFNDRYGLTEAVLQGRKTMTRRMVKDGTPLGNWGETEKYAKYKIGEVVAVAQNYRDVYEELKRIHGSSSRVTREFFHKYVQGGRMPVSNKMFVRADLMPHQIRITDIKVERLNDISEEDCLKEGVWIDSHREVLDDNIYTVDVFGKHYSQWHFPSEREAFSFLIDKVSSNGTWEHNPWVFAYSFELVK